MSSRISKPLTDKIRISASRREEALSILSGSESNISTVTAKSLATELFQRATDNFLLGYSASTLAQIASESHNFYTDYLGETTNATKEDHPARVSVFNPSEPERESVTVLLSAISDRPFIVDTVSEFLRVAKFDTSVFLHPILLDSDGNHTSLLYIELERIEDAAELKKLEDRLRRVLSELVFVTEDFDEIISESKKISDILLDDGAALDIAERTEAASLLRWLTNGGFVFLGFSRATKSETKSFGLFRSEDPLYQEQFDQLLGEKSSENFADDGSLVAFTKLPIISRVHRRSFIEALRINVPDSEESYVFLGLFTSKAIKQEALSIPVIRKKLNSTIENEGVLPNSHDYKEIVSLVDSMPKSELFQASTDDLSSIIEINLEVHQHSSTRLYLQSSHGEKFAYLVVVLMRTRFTMGARSRIQGILADEFKVPFDSIEHSLAITMDPLVRIHYAIPLSGVDSLKNIDLDDVETKVANMSLTWDDRLRIQAKNKFESKDPGLISFYQNSFPASYKASRTAEDALLDMGHLKALDEQNPIEASLEVPSEQSPENDGNLDLRIYKAGGIIALSDVVPLLEHTGFKIISEKITPLASSFSKDTFIYSFEISPGQSSREQVLKAKTTFLAGLKAILSGESDNDPLNELLVNPGLTVDQIAILRALQHYLWQLKTFASERVIARALVKHPQAASLLVEYMEAKFDPKNGLSSKSDRLSEMNRIRVDFLASLKSVPRLTHDRALRALLNVADAIVRTNAFSPDYPGCVAMKIDCGVVETMPNPRPLFETFVNSPRVEGVHLRSGMVSRGGLRWSERSEDYRTEVLGLMKTQRVKNAIIIPEGAKGGFVLKERSSDRRILSQLVEKGYKEFINCLLELSDNRVADKIVHPENMVVYDSHDPYLVVAADKGTATFSDLANTIASDKFKFWLDDAFASGGSNGYDHKKLGITAKGAWEAVVHHFRRIGINPDKTPFTCVGIGDMSGDVFGNGMLRSRNTKLVAAFNHKHIFIDPKPLTEKSFLERERLFSLPRSDWTDYDLSIISAGGGIFDRSSKEIPISKEAAETLGIDCKVLSGEEVVKSILRAPVDLLWNGGIGTYVRSSDESNLEVGDPSNDDVRISAKELQAKVIGEGGNLGLTQLARIEFSKIGGKLNTDAVDNSGGVDLSDQEVNFKILLKEPELRADISREERNEILESFAGEFCERVLYHNRSQCSALSVIGDDSRRNISDFSSFIDFLEKKRGLDRAGEFLPSSKILRKRRSQDKGLTRPESALVLAYSKMWSAETLLSSERLEDSFLDRYLFSYFPDEITSRYKKDILAHPLRKEIISTEAANCFTDLMGPVFLEQISDSFQCDEIEVLLSFLVVMELVEGREILQELHLLSSPESLPGQIFAIKKLRSIVSEGIVWFLSNGNLSDPSLEELFNKVSQSLEGFSKFEDSYGFEDNGLFDELQAVSIPDSTIRRLCLASLRCLNLEAASIAVDSKADLYSVSKIVSKFYSEIGLDSAISESHFNPSSSNNETSALKKLQKSFRNTAAQKIRSLVLKDEIVTSEQLDKLLAERQKIILSINSRLKCPKGSQLGSSELYLALEALERL